MVRLFQKSAAYLGKRAPTFTLTATLIFTAILSGYIHYNISRESQLRFTGLTDDLTERLQSRLAHYEDLLLQTRALFFAEKSVTRKLFHDYIKGLDLEKRFPGAQGIGYLEKIPKEKLSAHIKAIKSEGFSYYQVWPQTPVRDKYYPIVFIEPFDWRNQRAFGYDMMTDNTRQEAMLRAQDTREPALSGLVRLVQETSTDTQPGFLLYVPLYERRLPLETVEQRRAALSGYVYSPYRAHDFFKAFLGPESAAKLSIDFEVFSGNTPLKSNLLYDHDGILRSATGYDFANFHHTTELRFAGHTWHLAFHSLPGFVPFTYRYAPVFVALFGILLSLLFYSMARAVYNQTEREKRSQEVLKESEERFRKLVDASAQIVWTTDGSGEPLEESSSWREFTGQSIADRKNLGWLKVIHEEDQALTKDAWIKALQTRTPVKMEYRLRHVSGEWRWTTVRAVPVLDHNSEVRCWVGMNSDITDRKRIEARLQESEAYFRALVDTSPTMLWVTGPDGSCTYLSKQWYQYTGRTEGQDLGFGWLEAVHLEDRKNAGDIFLSANEKQASFRLEYRLKHCSGEFRSAIDVGNPRFDSHGNFIGYVGIVLDIHEQKLAEAELLYQNSLTQTITDNAASCLFMMDKKGHPTFMNPAAKLVTGYGSLEEIKDRPLHYAVHWKKPDGSHYPMEECPIDNAQAESKPVQDQEEIFCRKDGTLFPVSFSVAPLEKDGEIIGSVLEFRDITEQKKTEEALKDAIRARDEFLSIASHELKTPLASLKLASQLFKRNRAKGNTKIYEPNQVDGLVEQADKQASRLTRLVDDMLDIARIRTGKLAIQKERVNICDLVKEVVERLKASMIQAGTPTEFHCDEKIEGLWDKMRIEQVVTNLLTNAMRYGNKKTVAITVEKRGTTARILVQDQGIGIPKEAQARIFNRFERAVDAANITGLGLGLFITQQIVESHGGKIWVQSEVGKGSMFFVDLPIVHHEKPDGKDHGVQIHSLG